MQITDGSVLLVPLFHGTSSLFVDSIREFGLGAQNPNFELDTMRLLETIERRCPDEMRHDPELAVKWMILERILKQDRTQARFNFRHGGTYLSPGRHRAAMYAIGNLHGSELLSETLKMFRVLEESYPSIANEIAIEFSDATNLLHATPEPCIVEAGDVPIEILRSELGEPCNTQLEAMQEMLNKIGSQELDAMWQTYNFELSCSLPADYLSFFRIKRFNHDIPLPRYEVVPL